MSMSTTTEAASTYSHGPYIAVARGEIIEKLRSQLEECRDAIREIGGGLEVAEWTGNDRYRWILGRIKKVLQEAETVQIYDEGRPEDDGV